MFQMLDSNKCIPGWWLNKTLICICISMARAVLNIGAIGPFQFLSDPPVWKTLEFQLHFMSPNPMDDCGFVNVFDNLIHGKKY